MIHSHSAREQQIQAVLIPLNTLKSSLNVHFLNVHQCGMFSPSTERFWIMRSNGTPSPDFLQILYNLPISYQTYSGTLMGRIWINPHRSETLGREMGARFFYSFLNTETKLSVFWGILNKIQVSLYCSAQPSCYHLVVISTKNKDSSPAPQQISATQTTTVKTP